MKLPHSEDIILSKVKEHAIETLDEMLADTPPESISISDNKAEELLSEFSHQYYIKMRPPKVIYMGLAVKLVRHKVTS